jgi:segregation and condensation protein A
VNAEAQTTTYRVALPEFEGPLDLLLHLCKTHEIEVVNLPIAFITTKYLEYLEIMQTMPVDVAADYLVMAATLAYLKSRELVPAPEPLEGAALEDGTEEDGLDPRQELIRRLLEYQKYKDAAEKLGGRPIEGRNVWGRGAPIDGADVGPAPAADESVWKLIEAFGRILDKAGKGPVSTHDVVVDRVSIGDRINQLVDRLQGGGGSFRFESCFDLALPEAELRNQIVVTLLSILELARMKVVRVLQADDQETLFVTHIAGSDLAAARRVHVTSADEVVASAESGAGDLDEEDMTDAAGTFDEGGATDAGGTFDEGGATDAGGAFDEEAAGDSTLVEPAPAGAEKESAGAELQERGEARR